MAVLAGYAVLAVDRSADRVERDERAQGVEQSLAAVSDPVAALCAEDPAVRVRLGPACDTAAAAAAAPDGDVDEPTPARGITSVDTTDDGRLLVRYSDGTTQDVGQVVGAGIAGLDIVDGRLVVALTDGRVLDLGPVVGERGRGVDDVAVLDGRLVITYDDGTAQDAGPLPVVRPELPDTVTRTYPDGSSETCQRAGGDDSDPVYSCTDRTPPPADPSSDAPPEEP